jgi:hypothetical protein
MIVNKVIKEYKVVFGRGKKRQTRYYQTLEKAEAEVEEVLKLGFFHEAEIRQVYLTHLSFEDLEEQE